MKENGVRKEKGTVSLAKMIRKIRRKWHKCAKSWLSITPCYAMYILMSAIKKNEGIKNLSVAIFLGTVMSTE